MVASAETELDVAAALMKESFYPAAVFHLHLGLEKLLKAQYVDRTERQPPRTHNLAFLLRLADMALPAAERHVLVTLSPEAVQARYTFST
ncbi:MAG TPA: HEPN domain-containing protein [Dehalococcoidia bacterium]|nr:HEPN domain-containing protein [Dehalococcoidia bacterium]